MPYTGNQRPFNAGCADIHGQALSTSTGQRARGKSGHFNAARLKHQVLAAKPPTGRQFFGTQPGLIISARRGGIVQKPDSAFAAQSRACAQVTSPADTGLKKQIQKRLARPRSDSLPGNPGLMDVDS